MAKDDLFERFGEFIQKGAKSIKDRLTLDVTDLLRAIDQNKEEEVERALNAGVDPNAIDGIERIALPIAVDGNNPAIIRLLLKANANPNVRGKDGESALYKAVYWENQAIVEMLLLAGANPTWPNSNGVNPMDIAREKNYTTLLAMMEKASVGKRAKQIEKDKTIHEDLKAKAAAAKEEKEQAILRQQAAAKAAAAAKAEAEAAAAKQALEEKYAATEGNALKSLLLAMQQKDSEGVKVFVDKVADINAYDEDFKATPLMYAIGQKNAKLAQFLIEKGANVFTRPAKMDHSPLTKAILAQEYDLVAQMLATAPEEEVTAILNDPQQDLSPQFLAYKDAKMLNLLLGAGANAYFGGKLAPAPVVKAIEKASIGILPVLAGRGVDLNHEVDDKTPIEWAIHFNRKDWLIGLMEEGVAVDVVDEHAQTPIMKATIANSPDLVKILLAANARVDLKDNQGETVLEMATRLGDRQEIIDLLQS